jgi:membrane protein implicated in regulation of membrane protease activity
MSETSLVGRIGTVGVAIRGGDLPGEVRIVVEGLPHYYIAYSDEAVAEGQQVLVINSRGARRLDVEPWTQPGLGIADVFGANERF